MRKEKSKWNVNKLQQNYVDIHEKLSLSTTSAIPCRGWYSKGSEKAFSS